MLVPLGYCRCPFSAMIPGEKIRVLPTAAEPSIFITLSDTRPLIAEEDTWERLFSEFWYTWESSGFGWTQVWSARIFSEFL